VFRSERDGGGIYTIPALGGEPRLIARGGRNPSISADGTRMAFVIGQGGLGGVARAELFTIPLTGGTPTKLVPVEIGAASPVWSPDDRFILFARGQYRVEGWAIVPADVAAPAVGPSLEQFEAALSDGRWGSVVLLPLATLNKAGLADLTPRHWLPGNRILFSAKSGDASHVFEIGLSPPTLTRARWQLDPSPNRLTFGTGLEERPSLALGASAAGQHRLAFASLSRSENLWSLAVDGDRPRPGGRVDRLTQEAGFHVFPSVSADGTKVAFISHAAYNDIVWLLDVKTGKRSELTTAVSVKFKSRLRRDGSQVFFGVGARVGSVFAVSTTGGTPEELCRTCNAWVWDWIPDRLRILHWDRASGAVRATIANLETGQSRVFLERPGWDLYDFHWSPDGRWIGFQAAWAGASRLYVVPFTGDQGPTESTWIPITDGSTTEPKLDWSPDGNWIYSLSSRDGFLCLWAYPLDAQTKKPIGAPMPIHHSHGARLSMRNANIVSQEISVARDKIVFNQGEITGNIWMTELRR
jgi:Tol biopolymer transport system component